MEYSINIAMNIIKMDVLIVKFRIKGVRISEGPLYYTYISRPPLFNSQLAWWLLCGQVPPYYLVTVQIEVHSSCVMSAMVVKII